MRGFTYHRPPSIVDAIHLAGITTLPPTEAPAQFLAGGTTMLDLMKLDTMRPAQLVDLGEAGQNFNAIHTDGNGLHLGAFATMAETAAHPLVTKEYPVIMQSLLLAASAQIRNMATLGGMFFSALAAIISAIPAGHPATSAYLGRVVRRWKASTASMQSWVPAKLASPPMRGISHKP